MGMARQYSSHLLCEGRIGYWRSKGTTAWTRLANHRFYYRMEMEELTRNLSIFVVKKIIRLLLLLLAVSFITYLLIRLSPIDPVQTYIGADMMKVSPEQRAAIEEYWGIK